MWPSVLVLVGILGGALAAPALSSNSTLQRRLTTINDGTAFREGTIDGMTWQASGVTLSLASHSYPTLSPPRSFPGTRYVFATQPIHLQSIINCSRRHPRTRLHALN